MSALSTNQIEAFWLPFTPNTEFKRRPRIVARAEGMYYFDQDGRRVLDAAAGLWCANAGHCRPAIVKAIQEAAATLDFAPSFQFGHPKAFEAAAKIAALAPGDLNHVFFTNSGSESTDTAVKLAVAYHRARGEGTRTRIIGRERAYHGVGMVGISAGGLVNNKKWFNALAFPADHLTTTYNRKEQAFTNGLPTWGAHLADELEKLVALHDASTIAAVIVEPMAGSTGVLPPPEGYLKRLREIATKHGILLIFDEVITGFGRLGAAFAAERFGVTPDLLTFAKGVTSGAAPMGGVLVDKKIYDQFMTGPDHAIDMFHGYTYSGHPLAAAAACATLDLYRDEGLFERAKELEGYFGDAIHSLKGKPYVADIRNIGLAAAIDLDPIDGAAGKRGFDLMKTMFFDKDVMFRVAGDTLAFSPPLIVEKTHIDEMFGKLGEALDAL
ncbi:Beta-alanine--pyruvate aminotransferase [Alphaproteobacteria bacterium SO-S41]|nr:Beta-alanine--pyruvate aminotransferase [Alphaproteobacteria bacterium SO-S41]